MLCENCGEHEASVRITRIINGVSETHQYCRECAQKLTGRRNLQNKDWSEAVLKLLRNMFMQNTQVNSEEMIKKAEGLVCPTCGRTYREFAENGVFGCADCYEAFEPMLGTALMNIQGTASHQGAPASEKEKKQEAPDPFDENAMSPEEELGILEDRLKEAVRAEDYEAAARYRDQIRELKENGNG